MNVFRALRPQMVHRRCHGSLGLTRWDRDETPYVRESDAEFTRHHLLLRVRGAPMNLVASPRRPGVLAQMRCLSTKKGKMRPFRNFNRRLPAGCMTLGIGRGGRSRRPPSRALPAVCNVLHRRDWKTKGSHPPMADDSGWAIPPELRTLPRERDACGGTRAWTRPFVSAGRSRLPSSFPASG